MATFGSRSANSLSPALERAEAGVDAEIAVLPGSSAAAGDPDETGAPAERSRVGLAGLPQTSQYPSTIVPVHPGCAQAVSRSSFSGFAGSHPGRAAVGASSSAGEGDLGEAAGAAEANDAAPGRSEERRGGEE